MEPIEEKIYQLALKNINGLGPKGIRTLMSNFEKVSDIFKCSYKELLELRIKPTIIQQIIDQSTIAEATKEFGYCKRNDIQILFYKDEEYPKRLTFFDSMPIILYFRGENTMNAGKVISIVGTRDASSLGYLQCEKLIEQLVEYNCTIVSGLAFGVDAKAHQMALHYHLSTIGVMANGMNKIYPVEHITLAKKMTKNGGLLTEFPVNTVAQKQHFPMRNRIVAGMCDALIVIESAKKGGSMITAHYANEYNKDVFAFPGRFNDIKSQGCNALIKQHKAHLIESVEDLAYIMRWTKSPKAVQLSLFVDLTPSEDKLVHYLKHHGATHIDILIRQLNCSSNQLQVDILNLELKGMIKSLPGKQYICT